MRQPLRTACLAGAALLGLMLAARAAEPAPASAARAGSPRGADAAAPEVELRLRLSDAHAACLDRAGGVTAGMRGCIAAERGRWDARLNAAYRTLMASPDRTARVKALLRDAQRRWIAFRDAGCTAEGDLAADGGTLAGILVGDCLLRRTAQRAAELESAAHPDGAAPG